jgi:hypothetical protein
MKPCRTPIAWAALWLMTLALIDGRGSVVHAQSGGPRLTVRETAGIARNGEVVRSGLPIPRSLNVRNPGTLTLVDATNTPVPAEFRVLARWNAGREDSSAPIQWLLVTFPVTIATNGSATYRIVIDGSAGPNPSPAVAVSLSQNGNQVTVNTGGATFTLGGQAEALFDEIRLGSGTRLVSGGDLTAKVNGAIANHPTTRTVGIEHAGPLIAIVVVRGAYDLASVGGGGVGSLRRYVFTAGSPTAIVRQAVSWEGSRCGNGDLTCGGSINALRVERVRDTLTLDLAAPLSVMGVGAFTAPAIQGTASAGQSAWVRQRLRADRTAPLAFDVSVPGTSGAMGQKADGGMLAASNASGAVAVALNHLHRYEPQAVRLLGNGQLAVDLADDLAWLGTRQGLFATMAVSALPANPSRSDLDRAVWAPLNHPLHAWPAPEWFASSGAVDEIPVGPLPADLADYDSHVPAVLSHTLQQVDAKGLAGLMTFGLYPRHWGVAILSDELDCGDNDPTPGETWDNSYWCATWTDYHNTTATATVWAMRSGDVRLLDEIAFPAAWRSLHTQIMQCAPGDDYFYCGQAPAGYGGYRADFNSSHAYFDNLFLYYWLTGDQTVVETFARGASAMRDYLCRRRPAAPCLPHDPPADFYAQLTGRVASQWFAAFRFVGLASDDASYLEDYTSGLGRAVTQHYVEAAQSGTGYGFWLPGDTPVTGPGTYTTDQLWLLSLYDMNVLYRLQRDTNDAPIGDPALPPSQVRAAWARTLTRFGATVSGDGTANGRWPNQLTFSWSGDRIGGTLTGVSAAPGGGDPFLYDTGKATLTAALVRAGQETNDSSLIQMGADLTRLALAAMRGSEFGPLGKIQGEYLARVPAAVARLTLRSRGYVDHDFDGDGTSDILWQHTSGNVVLWLMNANGTVESSLGLDTVAGWTPRIGDFNGDGIADILWQNTASGHAGVWLMKADGAVLSSFGLGNLAGWTPSMGDFNGDGIADLLWQHASSGNAVLWFMSANGMVQGNVALGSIAGWTPTVGDFNGDGIADLLWQSTASGHVAMWLMNPNGTVQSSVGLGNLSGWTPAVGDFNGDGIADLLWQSTASGHAAMWLMNPNGTVQSSAGLGNLAGWTPRVGDFNGDGKADILWHNAASGNVAVWLMNGMTVSQSLGVGNAAGWTTR